MIRAIDNTLLALFQALVNWSQRKPMWWASQCTPVVLVCGVHVLVAGWGVIPAWVNVMGALALLLLCTVFFLYTHDLEMWEIQRGQMSFGYRLMTIATVATGLLAESIVIVVLDLAVVAYAYFASCEDPPPPRRRTAPKLSTEGAS